MNYLQKKEKGKKALKRGLTWNLLQIKTAITFIFCQKLDAVFHVIDERKAALSGMWVKGHGKSKDGRVSCRHPSEWTGNNPTFLTHPGNIVWKRKSWENVAVQWPITYTFYYAIFKFTVTVWEVTANNRVKMGLWN